jgi:hypothetical protein
VGLKRYVLGLDESLLGSRAEEPLIMIRVITCLEGMVAKSKIRWSSNGQLRYAIYELL